MKRFVLYMIAAVVIIVFTTAVAFSEVRKKVTLFPFNDLSLSRLDMNSVSIIGAELSKIDFIELVPVEVVRQKVLDFEPAFLWTGQMTAQTSGQTTAQTSTSGTAQNFSQNTTQNTIRNTNQRTGGILWNIRPRIIEQVSRGLSSDYSIHGDIAENNKKMEINARITDNKSNVLRTFAATAASRDRLAEELARLGRRISAFFEETTAVEKAEDEVRNYLAGFYSLDTVVGKIQGMSVLYPNSLPLRAILLDLYLKDQTAFSVRIRPAAERIIALYDPANGDDTRYLLALYQDPYDVLAAQFEASGDWARSIAVRERALQEFPFFADKQKKAIGHAAFVLAQGFETKKSMDRAAEYYRKAISLLPQGSDEARKSRDRLKELGGQ